MRCINDGKLYINTIKSDQIKLNKVLNMHPNREGSFVLLKNEEKEEDMNPVQRLERDKALLSRLEQKYFILKYLLAAAGGATLVLSYFSSKWFLEDASKCDEHDHPNVQCTSEQKQEADGAANGWLVVSFASFFGPCGFGAGAWACHTLQKEAKHARIAIEQELKAGLSILR